MVSDNARKVDWAQGGAWVQSDTFGWVGLDSLTDRREVGRTEDGEDRRQRRMSVRVDGVRILWRGNTWRMDMRASTCIGAGLIPVSYTHLTLPTNREV